MSFKLNIRGRDDFLPPPAANPANPLIGDHEGVQKEVGTPEFGSSAETVPDLAGYTISRLAGLAGPAIEKEVLPYRLDDADRDLAKAYHQHHFGCALCCAAGQDRGSRCIVGLGLWNQYLGETRADEGRGNEQ